MPRIKMFEEGKRPSAIELNRIARFIERLQSSDGSLLITYNENGAGTAGSVEFNLGPKAFNTIYNALTHDPTTKEYVGEALKPYVLSPPAGIVVMGSETEEATWFETVEFPPPSA